MEKQIKNYQYDSQQVAKPLVMREFTSENDGLNFAYDDIKAAESEGYSKGFSEGIELGISQGELKAIREMDVIIQELLHKLDQSLKEIASCEHAFFENFFPSIVKTCLIILRKVMPHFFHNHGKEEMENTLKEVVGSFIIREPIQVKISANAYEHLLDRLKNLLSTYPKTLEFIKTSELEDNACEIEWAGGSSKWNLQSRYQQAEEKLQEYLNAEQGEYHG